MKVRWIKTLPLFLVALSAGIGLGSLPGTAYAGGRACHEAPPTRDASGQLVLMTRNCFSPTVLRVAEGTSVTFRNDDEMIHHIAGVASAWGSMSETLKLGDQRNYVFEAAGIYPYSCNLHVGMSGAIVVGDGRAVSAAEGAVREVAIPVSQSSNAQAAAPQEPLAPSTATAIVPPESDAQSPLLFSLLGGVIGAVVVGLGFGARELRR